MAGLYHSISDSPDQLKIEAETMTIKAAYGKPTVGQATVSWEIPMPARGCASGNTGTYCGIVVVLSKEPIKTLNYPTDGIYYHDDPTADSDKHIGDKIGKALVVGSFWEREAKSTGSTNMITSFIINDIDPSSPYFIAGFMMDCTLRYHTEGIRAYSDELKHNKDDTGTVSYQNIALGPNHMGVIPTDGTGLIPGKKYQFDVLYDAEFPTGRKYINHSIMIDGLNSGTYQDLLNEINKSFATIGNPIRSPYPPHYGFLYWNDEKQKLYKFNGSSYEEITNIFIRETDPAIINDGEYWYNPKTGELWVWGGASPGGWIPAKFMTGITHPEKIECDQYWFDGTTAYIWNGTSWVSLDTIVQGKCPTSGHIPTCGTYWFDTANEILYEWDVIRRSWMETSAIYWPRRPDQQQNGEYWINNETLRLSHWSGVSPKMWIDITDSDEIYIQELEPKNPNVDAMWYKISTEILYKWNMLVREWNEEHVIVWPSDPTDTSINNLWWNSTDDYVYQWDSNSPSDSPPNGEWIPVPEFIESNTDAVEGIPLPVDTMWFDSDTKTMYRWDGESWVEVVAIVWPHPPNEPQDGDIFFDKKESNWYIYKNSPDGWKVIDLITSNINPTNIPTGYYWMKHPQDILYVRNGLDWLPVDYETEPYKHVLHEKWYDMDNNIIYEWNGSKWIMSNGELKAIFADFNHDGCKQGGGIQIRTTKKGTGTIVFVPVMEGNKLVGQGCVTSGFADPNPIAITTRGGLTCSYYSNYGASCGYPARDIHNEDFLWSNLKEPAAILPPKEGQDYPHNKPSYDVMGIGKSGEVGFRRELADSIRRQLGYPSIAVELTHYQIDTAIQGALESYRKRVSASLKRGFFFLDLKPKQQRYLMTNRRVGFDTIVEIMDTHRFTSSFLTTAHGAGVYAQAALQHLYQAGSYDLLSYDLVSQYISQLEISFAARLQYTWNEDNRALDFHQSIHRSETILLDVMIERTEESILSDRFAKSWIEKYSYSECLYILGQIRSKYSGGLPGAGGGIQLNGAELIAMADSYKEELYAQIDEFVIEKPEAVGASASFVFG